MPPTRSSSITVARACCGRSTRDRTSRRCTSRSSPNSARRRSDVLRRFFQGRPELKSQRELGLMREAGKLVAAAHRVAREMAKPGTKTIDIDEAGEELFRKNGAQRLFKGYQGGMKVPFPAATCLSLNEQVVHGIPGNRILKEGDILKIDTACKLNGWCADAAVTLPIGEVRPELRRMIKVAWEALDIAIEALRGRHDWSEVALRMPHH